MAPGPIRSHPEGAARRGEAAPRPYLLIAYPHVIDGLERLHFSLSLLGFRNILSSFVETERFVLEWLT
jgi:hypothetical protein